MTSDTNRAGSLRDDLAAQRDFVRDRVPAYARLLDLLEAELDRGLEAQLVRAWEGRTFGAWYERPLLVLAALRDDVLREGPAHPLWAVLGASEPSAAAITESTVRAAIAPTCSHFWTTLARRYLQTNEPSRAVAWLWPAALAARAAPRRPLALFDVGASAGLNLVADQLPPMWNRQGGAPLEVTPIPQVASRLGFDLRPLDPLDPADARWLRACVWAGKRDRLAHLDQAIEAYERLQSEPCAPTVRRADAAEIPELLPREEDDELALAYQTIVRDYFPATTRERYERGMREWLSARSFGTAVWIELEVGKRARSGGPPAALTAHVRTPGGIQCLELATCEPHPSVLEVSDGAVTALLAALTPRTSKAS